MIKRIISVTVISFSLSLLANSISFSQVNQHWVQRYNGLDNSYDEAEAIAVDKSGNVYVTGSSVGATNNWDYATIKYSSSGVQLWIQRYDNSSDDVAKAIALDDSGNVYVTGSSVGSYGCDYATIKYNSQGEQQWVQRYNGLNHVNSCDVAEAIAVDKSGNVYVTGYSDSLLYDEDFVTIKYTSLGVLQWIQRDDKSSEDIAKAIALDELGNVYVTGTTLDNSMTDYATIKYNSQGDQQWVQRYSYLNSDDMPEAIAVDKSGNVYVTGASVGDELNQHAHFVTIKYTSLGVLQWIQLYESSEAKAIALDDSSNVYVTGKSWGIVTDYATVKYNSQGEQQWAQRYNGLDNSLDEAEAIAVDKSGNVYVTGFSGGSGSFNDYVTIKYSSSGVQQWIQTYDNSRSDVAKAIALDDSGNVYVTGTSWGGDNKNDFATIKYPPKPTAQVRIKLLFEGTFYPLFNMLTRRDTVKAYLANSTLPFEIIDSATAVIDSMKFTGTFNFQIPAETNYYLVLKHYNSVETWSKAGGIFVSVSDTTFLDLTSSASQAYGNNLKLKGGKYCLISGDVFQDGFIDGTDLMMIDNDAFNFSTGRFLQSDLNGDGFTDAQDMLLAGNNRSREVIRP